MSVLKVIVISEFLKRIVDNYFKKEKIVVIRSSIDENLCDKMLNKVISVGKNEFVISVLGVITPSKNQLLLLRALKNIDVKENILVNIIGRVEDIKYYKTLSLFSEQNIADSIKIVFTGELVKEKALEKIIESDLIVVTSKYEGMSLVIAEAMYLKKLIVSTRTGVAEEIISDGVNGFLIRDDDYIKLRQVISDIIKNPDLKTTLTRFHTEYFNKYFSMKEYLRKHEEIIFDGS